MGINKEITNTQQGWFNEDVESLLGANAEPANNFGYANAGGLKNLISNVKTAVKTAAQERKNEKAARQDAKEEYKGDKAALKARLDKGEITRDEYNKLLKGEKIEKRTTIKTSGGGNIIGRTLGTITAPMKAGIMAAFRINLFGISTALYPATIPESEWAKNNFNTGNAKKAVGVYNDLINKKLVKFLKGSGANAKLMIQEGAKKKITKLSKGQLVTTTEGYTNPKAAGMAKASGDDFFAYEAATATVTAGLILSAIVAIGEIVTALKEAGISKNPYNDKNGNPQNVPSPNIDETERMAYYEKWINDTFTGTDKDDMLAFLKANGVTAFEKLLEENQAPPSTGNGEGGKMSPLMIGGIVGGVLLVAGTALFFVFRKK